MLRKTLLPLSILLLATTSQVAMADMITAKVDRLGCHKDSNVCFVYLELTQDIPTSCANNDSSLRWDGINDRNADRIFSILLAAQSTDTPVTFGGAGDSCYSSFPTFRWLHNN